MRAPRHAPPLEVERHRPERFWETAVVGSVCCSSCCCCCCCCAHTVGAFAGAAAGSVRSLKKAQGDPAKQRGAMTATLAYWGGVAAVTFLGLVLAALLEEPLIGLIALAVLAPALQLVGSFVALPTILLQPTDEGGRAAADAVRSATLGWFVGGLLGGVLVVVGMVILVLLAAAMS